MIEYKIDQILSSLTHSDYKILDQFNPLVIEGKIWSNSIESDS